MRTVTYSVLPCLFGLCALVAPGVAHSASSLPSVGAVPPPSAPAKGVAVQEQIDSVMKSALSTLDDIQALAEELQALQERKPERPTTSSRGQENPAQFLARVRAWEAEVEAVSVELAAANLRIIQARVSLSHIRNKRLSQAKRQDQEAREKIAEATKVLAKAERAAKKAGVLVKQSREHSRRLLPPKIDPRLPAD